MRFIIMPSRIPNPLLFWIAKMFCIKRWGTNRFRRPSSHRLTRPKSPARFIAKPGSAACSAIIIAKRHNDLAHFQFSRS
ncbi:MAG TPA: hypothetical protein VKX17_12040 [Planctomycetota bacterium]|nr:hypothetical protein [Planctomycetota bacterium]